MSRVVNTNSPGKRRNYHMRSCAELLRHLSQKEGFDDESKDMLAAIVYALRGINETIDDAVEAWEKRDYWIKAERFRQEWDWVSSCYHDLHTTLREQQWQAVPQYMARLFPHFSGITINKFTRSEELWQGKYHDLIAEK